VVLSLLSSLPCIATAPSRPNLLFLFADDQQADTLSAWGNPHIRTPHLDRLVHEGFSFRGNYCFGGNSGAVCIPSRAMLMSGRTWFHVDHALTHVPLLPEVLGQNGYVTFGTGKWHNGAPSFVRAFQQGRRVFLGGMDDHRKTAIRDLLPDRTFSEPQPAQPFSTTAFADAAIAFIQNHQGPQPFFAYVAFTAPHDPRDPPDSHRFPPDRPLPPLPPNFLPQHPFDNGQLVLRDENLAPWPRPPEVIREQLAEYYGLIEHLDQQIGRVLVALRDSPHATNTIVIYAADHGLAVGSHGLLGKQNLYEHSMRCPLILSGPGIPRGQATRAFTYLLDLFPTVCALANVPTPEGLDGHNLQPLWTSQVRVRDTVFLPYTNLMRSLRDDRWKLICYPQINHRQLFDLAYDPHEIHDLAQDPAFAPHVERLLAQLQDTQAAHGDSQPLTVAEPRPRHRDLTGLDRKPDPWQPEWIVQKYFPQPTP
jgi:arylsulfatase A-like enzyme